MSAEHRNYYSAKGDYPGEVGPSRHDTSHTPAMRNGNQNSFNYANPGAVQPNVVGQIAEDLVRASSNSYAKFPRNSYPAVEPLKSVDCSEFETALLNAPRPFELEEPEVVTVNGQTGILANKRELLKWQGEVPLSQYQINEDPYPEVIQKRTDQTLVYEQEVAVRYLRPPTPPPPGEILIRQEKNIPTPAAPPVIIRQQPSRPETPTPLVLREAPPKPPTPLGNKLITISGKRLPPPPRKVVIERLPPLPSKPQSYIVERWMPYTVQQRRVIFQKNNEPDPVIAKPKNVIIQWEAPNVQVKQTYKDLGVVKANPNEYLQKYGTELKDLYDLPDFIRELKPTNGITLAGDKSGVQSPPIELVGDIEALKLIDLDANGLSEYKHLLNQIPQSPHFAHMDEQQMHHRSHPSSPNFAHMTDHMQPIYHAPSALQSASTTPIHPSTPPPTNQLSLATLNINLGNFSDLQSYGPPDSYTGGLSAYGGGNNNGPSPQMRPPPMHHQQGPPFNNHQGPQFNHHHGPSFNHPHGPPFSHPQPESYNQDTFAHHGQVLPPPSFNNNNNNNNAIRSETYSQPTSPNHNQPPSGAFNQALPSPPTFNNINNNTIRSATYSQPPSPSTANQHPSAEFNQAPSNNQERSTPYNNRPHSETYASPPSESYNPPHSDRYNQAPPTPYNQPPHSAPFNQPPSTPFNQPTSTQFTHPQSAPFNKPQSAPFNQPQSAPFNQPQSAPFNQPQSAQFSQPPSVPFSQPQSAPFNQPHTAPYKQPPGMKSLSPNYSSSPSSRSLSPNLVSEKSVVTAPIVPQHQAYQGHQGHQAHQGAAFQRTMPQNSPAIAPYNNFNSRCNPMLASGHSEHSSASNAMTTTRQESIPSMYGVAGAYSHQTPAYDNAYQSNVAFRFHANNQLHNAQQQPGATLSHPSNDATQRCSAEFNPCLPQAVSYGGSSVQPYESSKVPSPVSACGASKTNFTVQSTVNVTSNNRIDSLFIELFPQMQRNYGKLTIHEGERILMVLNSRLGRYYGNSETQAFFRALDTNGDGVIDLEEFKAALNRYV